MNFEIASIEILYRQLEKIPDGHFFFKYWSPIAFLVIVLFSIPAYGNRSFFKRLKKQEVSAQAAMIDCLIDIREKTPKNLVLRPAPGLLLNNPVSRCTAKPFVFPALSEHAWIEVIQVERDCEYIYYGYELYGVGQNGNKAIVLPELRGMKIIDKESACTN